MTEALSSEQTARDGYAAGIDAASIAEPAPINLEALWQEGCAALNRLGAVVGVGVVPIMQTHITGLYGAATIHRREATRWRDMYSQLVADRARVEAEHGEAYEGLVREYTEAIDQRDSARSIACQLEADNARLGELQIALLGDAADLIGLPVIVDYSIPPGTIELRDAIGTTLGRITNINVDADDLASTASIALGSDPDEEGVPFDAIGVLGSAPDTDLAWTAVLPAADGGAPWSDAAPSSAEEIIAGLRDDGYNIVGVNEEVLPDRGTAHSFVPAVGIDPNRCARRVAPLTPAVPATICGGEQHTLVHMPAHRFIKRVGRCGCGADPLGDGHQCGYVDGAACHRDPATRVRNDDGKVL